VRENRGHQANAAPGEKEGRGGMNKGPDWKKEGRVPKGAVAGLRGRCHSIMRAAGRRLGGLE